MSDNTDFQLKPGEFWSNGILHGWTGKKCPKCEGMGLTSRWGDICRSCGGTGDEHGPLPEQLKPKLFAEAPRKPIHDDLSFEFTPERNFVYYRSHFVVKDLEVERLTPNPGWHYVVDFRLHLKKFWFDGLRWHKHGLTQTPERMREIGYVYSHGVPFGSVK